MRKFYITLILILLTDIFRIHSIIAFQGDMGYNGGVSSGFSLKSQSMKYTEIVFISGEPIEFVGNVVLKKSIKIDNKTGNEILSINYVYSLANSDKKAQLQRTETLETERIKKSNNQIVEKTKLSVKPTEVIRIGTNIYALDNIEFTKSNLIDVNPTIEYFTGTIWFRKTFNVRTDASPTSIGSVTYEATGRTYGYDQYWSSVETIVLDATLKTEVKVNDVNDKWGGSVKLKVSNSSTKRINYEENEVDTISFDGGFILEDYNKGITQYRTKMPEFDSDGLSTLKILDKRGSASIDSFPDKQHLVSYNLDYLKGHWAFEHVSRLYALEIFDDDVFNVNQYINRGEFTTALEKAAKEVPKDSVYDKIKKQNKTTIDDFKFSDLTEENKYYKSINKAYKRGLVKGRGDNTFASGSYLTTADAITIMINSIGLSRMANWPGAVSIFRDNDDIPDYARNSIIAAQKIGLIVGDERGYLEPQSWLTKSRAAAIINNYIDFMRNDIMNEYTQNLINYN